MVRGFILDSYPSKDRDEATNFKSGMTFWLKTTEGKVVKLQDKEWRARIYASGPATDEPEYLLSRLKSKTSLDLVHSIHETFKKASILDEEKSRVLEIELNEADKTRKTAELLEGIFANPSTFSLYNVDVLPEQQYYYEKELFPLAFVDVETAQHGQIENWTLLDDVNSTQYALPPLKSLLLDVEISDRVPRFDSKLRSITLSLLDEEEISNF